VVFVSPCILRANSSSKKPAEAVLDGDLLVLDLDELLELLDRDQAPKVKPSLVAIGVAFGAWPSLRGCRWSPAGRRECGRWLILKGGQGHYDIVFVEGKLKLVPSPKRCPLPVLWWVR